MAGVSVRFGRPQGKDRVTAKLGAAVSKGLARAIVKRVQARVNHPAADALRAKGVNQYQAVVAGPRGGPGIIRPVRAKALRFKGRGGIVFAQSVNGAGLLPLIVAEGERLSNKDADEIVKGIKL